MGKGENGNGEIKVNGKALVLPDFVFHPDNKLSSLYSVHDFIAQNQHLPDMPSKKDIGEKGLDIITFSMKLLQKIEELTLYVIDLQKQIDELKKQ